jgi:hypothetical protein
MGLTIVRAKIDMLKGLHRMIKKRTGIQKKVSADTIEKWIRIWSRA